MLLTITLPYKRKMLIGRMKVDEIYIPHQYKATVYSGPAGMVNLLEQFDTFMGLIVIEIR